MAAKVSDLFSSSKKSSFASSADFKINKIKRNSSNLPLSAYTSSVWCHFFSREYENIFKEKYKNYPSKIESESITISNIIYPIVFDDLKYSALDFSIFIKKYLNFMNNRKKDISIFMLKTESSKEKMISFQKESIKNREESVFDDIIYIPHNPLSGDPDDLEFVISTKGMTGLKLIINFGIPIYHKYLMVNTKMSFTQASEVTKKIIIKDVISKYKNNEELIRNIFSLIFKNSIQWEPYTEEDHVKGIRTSGHYFIDWRKEFEDYIDFFDLQREEWWKSQESSQNLKIIPSVKKFFLKKNLLA